MCGICGSNILKEAFALYVENLKRGTFASGFLAVGKDIDPLCIKQQDPFTLEQLESLCNGIEYDYFLFHGRAPTNSNTPYSEETTHPFYKDGIYVAHNGIITNWKDIAEPRTLVDSEVILQQILKKRDEQPPMEMGYALRDIFSNLQGLLTCWIYDQYNHDIWLIKGGSSLWYGKGNSKNDAYADWFNFSSSEHKELAHKESIMISQRYSNEWPCDLGIIFRIIPKLGVCPFTKFNYDNPYFIL